MALNEEQKKNIAQLVAKSLDEAESHWKRRGHELTEDSLEFLEKSASVESKESLIPNNPLVREGSTVVENLIAYVADIRNSTEHLLCETSKKKSSISGIQRIFYETSALLPALDRTINFENGQVTEYLGDGVLAFFPVDEDHAARDIKSAYRAARHSLSDTRDIVNSVLRERYQLEDLDFGVGLAYSKTLVSLVGPSNNRHPKAFGRSVFRATKLSDGRNRIRVDEFLRRMWPQAKGGGLQFNLTDKYSFGAYTVIDNS